MIQFENLIESSLTDTKQNSINVDLSMYHKPPPRAKFQEGDIVVIRDDGRFKDYHSKKYWPYNNKVGTVVSYRNVPGAYSKFALRFEDSVVLPIHSQFIDGPFRDVKTALKYQDNRTPIDVNDIKGAAIDKKWETRPQIESKLRELLCKPPFNFQWHDTIKEKTYNKIVEFSLASNNGCELLRINNIRTKKLFSFNPYIISTPPQYYSSYHGDSNPLMGIPKAANQTIDVLSYISPKFNEYYNINTLNEAIQEAYHRNIICKEIEKITGQYYVNDTIVYNLLIDNLERDGSNWVYQSDYITFNPFITSGSELFKGLTLKCKEATAYITNGSFEGCPKIIEGNFKIQTHLPEDQLNFDHMPVVLGEIIGIDTALYKQHKVSNALHNIKNHSELSALFKKKM